MNTIMKATIINIITCCLVLFLSFTSCQENELATIEHIGMEEDIPLEEYAGEILDVDYEIAIPQYADVVDTEARVESRSLTEDGEGKIHFDYANMKDVLIHVCLQNGDDVSTRSFKTFSAKIEPKAGGGFQVLVDNPYIRLKRGDLSGDNWKVCALMESQERTQAQRMFDQDKYTATINTNTYFSPDGNIVKDHLTSLTTPLYSQYVSVRKEDGKVFLDLNFKPLGTIVRMKVTNPLAIPVYVNKVRIKNPNIKSGLARVSLGDESNGILTFNFSASSRASAGETSRSDRALWANNEVCIWNIKPVEVGTTPENLYLWCIPVSSTPSTSQVEFVYTTSLSNDNMLKDSIILPPSERTADLKSGYFYQVNASLPESDLMITELLHLNPSWWYNYTVVEIYNPTNKEIDIRNYGLCRILSWDTDLPLMVGEANSFPKSLDQALVQDLYVENFNQTVYRGDGQKAHISYQGNNRFYDMYGTHVNKGPARYMLKPGNTVVLGAGQLRYELANKSTSSQYYWPTGSLMYDSPYLANAVKMGFCQYAVAVDNGSTASQYVNERYMNTAGVLQHGARQVLVLVKKSAQGQSYTPVDWLYSACTPSIMQQLQQKALPVFSGVMSGDWVFVARKEGVMYPVAERDNEVFLDASKSHLPLDDAIYDMSYTYQFYDWVYRFGMEPRSYRSEVKPFMTPGTRFYNPAVENNNVWLPGAYNETGNSTTPNPRIGK